jgi:HSP20 family protein
MNTNVQNATESAVSMNKYTSVPPVDIFEDKDGYKLIADMPGVSKENLDISIDNRELTISGSTSDEQKEAEYSEFILGNYKRKFVLNEEIDSTGINASMDNGVLTLILPKRESVKPRKIEIKTA